jgi:hypothetical protein
MSLEGTACRDDPHLNRVPLVAEITDDRPKHLSGNSQSWEAAGNPKINRENHHLCQVK